MSWAISHKHKFIFIHIPKTGGTSICGPKTIWKSAALFRLLDKNDINPGGHRSAKQLLERYNREAKEYFTFTMLREPLERMVSMYWAVLRGHIMEEISFEEFVEILPTAHKVAHWGLPQWWWLDGGRVDYVGDFADIDGSWKEICGLVGIEHSKVRKLNSSGKTDHLSLYNDRTESIIREVYAKDFELYEEIRR